MKLLFEEKQHMRQPWLLAITLAPILIPVLIVYFGDDLPTNGSITRAGELAFMISMISFAGIMFSFFYFSKLTTQVYEDRIEYGWNLPTKDLNVLYWSNVKSVELINYTFVGYGYRLSTIYGTVYNTSGDIGIQLIKKNGEKLLIGSNKTDELKKSIEVVKLILT